MTSASAASRAVALFSAGQKHLPRDGLHELGVGVEEEDVVKRFQRLLLLQKNLKPAQRGKRPGVGFLRTDMLLLCVPLVLQVGLLGLGCGIIVSSLTTRYRDLMVVVTFGVQLWMYGSPVVYPLSMITHPVLRAVMVINPMTAPMESFRYIFFGTGQVTGIMWASSLIWTVALLALGLSLFSKVEKTFVDTV